jgi:hypothetical protein
LALTFELLCPSTRNFESQHDDDDSKLTAGSLSRQGLPICGWSGVPLPYLPYLVIQITVEDPPQAEDDPDAPDLPSPRTRVVSCWLTSGQENAFAIDEAPGFLLFLVDA